MQHRMVSVGGAEGQILTKNSQGEAVADTRGYFPPSNACCDEWGTHENAEDDPEDGRGREALTATIGGKGAG